MTTTIPTFTATQYFTLRQYALGYTAREIAAQRGVKTSTVNRTIQSLEVKYADVFRDGNSKVALRQRAIEDRIIEQGQWAPGHEGGRSRAPQPKVTEFTETQRTVLTLWATGFNTAEIAHMLHMKKSTVRSHTYRIRERYANQGRPAPFKADVRQRAIEDGLITPDRIKR